MNKEINSGQGQNTMIREDGSIITSSLFSYVSEDDEENIWVIWHNNQITRISRVTENNVTIDEDNF